MYSVDAISPERATDYAKKLFEMRVRGWSKMSPRSFKRLMKGETKEPGTSVFTRVRHAYLDYCHTIIKRLQNEIRIEEEINRDADLEDIGARLAALESEVEAAKRFRPTGERKR